MGNNGPQIDPWGTPLWVVSQLEENSPLEFCGDILTFYFPFVRYVLNWWALAAWIPC